MDAKIKTLIEQYGMDDQRTEAWHAKRGEMLTASEIYKALNDASPALKHELMMSKLTPRPRTEGAGPRALLWGTRFEPIAKELYCRFQGSIQIVDTTCIPHPFQPFLGASPDGIIVANDPLDFRHGKLVEFKCPISREFSDTTPVPSTYFHQMQLQMECCQLHECEYIEMGFKELNFAGWVDCLSEYKSFYAIHMDTGQVLYHGLDDKRDVPTWRREVLPDGENWELLFWHLNSWRALTVPHDPTWLPTNLDSMRGIWESIQEHRKAGTLPEHPKDKKTLTLEL